MSEGENMFAKINIKGIREPLVFNLKILDLHASPVPEITVYFSTKVSNPNEQHHDAVFHNVRTLKILFF